MMFIKRVALERIRPNPYQPRESVDQEGIYTLAQDIKANGLQQMPSGRAVDAEGKLCAYEDACLVQLAFGHRRWKAFQLLSIDDEQYEDLPVQIVTYDDERMALAAWSENESRKNLNPVERARAVLKMIEAFGWTQDQAADKVRVARTTISNMLRMLRLPGEVLAPLSEGAISERQAMGMLPYYELGRAQRERLTEDGYFLEFLQLARQGMIDSDTIRRKVAEAIEAAFPKPVTPSLLDSLNVEGVNLIDLNVSTLPLPNPSPSLEGRKEEVEGPEWFDENGVVSITPEEPDAADAPMAPIDTHDPIMHDIGPASSPHPGPLPLSERAREEDPEPAAPPVTPSLQAAPSASPASPPKTWDESTIQLSVTMMPVDGNADGRIVTVGGQVNGGAPVIKFFRMADVHLDGGLAEVLKELSDQFEGEKG